MLDACLLVGLVIALAFALLLAAGLFILLIMAIGTWFFDKLGIG